MATDESIGHFKIHNVGFYNVAARPIKCISFNEETLKLAVSRDDASIEIWNMRDAVFMEKCILGQPASSVEGLGWLDNRLFSTGLTEGLVEWNLKELKAKQKVSLTGNAAWCMDIDKKNGCIAVGTYEGYINTFWVDGDDLNFLRLFDKQEGAIRCCKYNSDGRYIVTGSSDTIRIWDVAKGHAMYRMDTGRLEKNAETTVYSLVVLKDLTIIAGDSRGCLTVWNGSNGTRIDSIDALTGDVLAVAVNDEETQLCCSGVDQKIRIYVQIPRSKDFQRKWIPNLKRNVHSHDVQALTFIGENQIVSAGVDGFINVSRSVKEPNSNKYQYGPFLPQPCAVVAVSPRLLLLKYFNHLEVWRLGRPNDKIQLSDEGEGQKMFLKLDENVEELVELRSTSGQPITCASISPNGMFLIYSTESAVKLYQLDTVKQKASLTKVKVDSDKFTAPIAKVLFSSDSKSMYCVKNNGNIEIFSLFYNDEVDIKATISTKEVIKDAISLVSLSKCERYLVCAGACGTLAVWKNSNNRWRYFKTLSGRNYAPTAMTIHNKSCRLVLAYSDYQIYERDLENDSVVCTATDLLTSLTGTTYTAINNILLDDNNENVVILHNDASLFVLEKGKGKDSESPSTKRVIPEPTDARSQYYKLKKKNLGNYEHFVHLSWLSASEMVAISVNAVTLIESLPGPMYRKQFGNS